MLSAIIVGAIVIAVALGYKTKINTGFFAIGFAYFIGCFILGLSTKEVIATWPVSTMFVIFSVSLFYNFAMVNGTLEKTARYLLYACRKIPKLLPYALYFTAAVIAALGAGYFTVLAFMAPISLLICKEAKMNQLIGAVAVNCGALSGANFMTSGSGVIFRGLMDSAGYTDTSFANSMVIFITSVVFSVLLIFVMGLLNKSKESTSAQVSFEKPEAYTKKQKTNLVLILTMMVIVLIFPIMNIMAPDVEMISFINKRLDVGLVAIIFSIIALLLNLAPQKDVIAKVPWNTIIMICGVGMLIQIAIKAGTLDLLSNWVGSSLSPVIVPIAFSLVAAAMSSFSSTLGVVTPALFPLIPVISQTTGIDAALLFTCIVIGAQSSAISPFSSGGSLILGSCEDEEVRGTLFNKLLFVAMPISVILGAVYSTILSFIL